MKALVIGSGIGGLAVARALQSVGINVTVFERRCAENLGGSGLALWTNGMRALAALGLERAVVAAGRPIECVELRSSKGRLLRRAPFGEMDFRFGVAGVGIHRANLVWVMRRELGEGVVRFGMRFVGFEQDSGGIIAHFACGHREYADMLIGADGVHSRVRAQVHADARLRPRGYASWRGVTSLECDTPPPGTMWEIHGRGARFALVHIGGERLYWWATATLAPPAPGTDRSATAALLERFQDWHEPVPSVIRATMPGAIVRDEAYDLPPEAVWGEGRVTLLGDAAHPMAPDIGQGACLALEDAVELAAALRQEPGIEAALRVYEARRRARTAGLVRMARRYGWIAQWQNEVACSIRGLLMRLMPAALFTQRIDYVCGYAGPDDLMLFPIDHPASS